MTSFRTLSEALDLGEKALVAFVGAGGKTSLMSRLAFELFEDRNKLAVTTTTHLALGEVRDFWNASKLAEKDKGAIGEILRRAVMVSRVPFFYSGADTPERLKGISTDAAEELYGKVDFLLVEADGGRQASFKIPRPHEPVLPPSTTHLCIVMGAEIFEQPAGRDLIFNLDDINRIMTIKEGEICPPRLLKKLLFRDDGYLKHATPERKTFLLINKVDSAERVEAVIPAADELFHPALEGIVLTSHESGRPVVSADNARGNIAAVILAAGKSERFGGQKLCEKVDGEPLILRVVTAALESGVERVCVVLGYDGGNVRGSLDVLPSHADMMIIDNKRYEEGLGRSISEGIKAISQWADAAMILLADMPGIDADLMDRVISKYKKSNARLCHAVVGERHCHPVVFRKEFFPELIKLSGDEGAREICEANRQWAHVVTLEDDSTQVDIDTPEDLKKFDL